MNRWELPESVTIDGREYVIHADYRDILDIVSHLQNPEDTEQERIYIALALFYENFDSMPPDDYQAALDSLLLFLNCGEAETDTRPQPKLIDWDQDADLIVSGINKAAGMEIRSLPFLHWWTFISFFNAIGDGPLATVVSIREKRRKGKKLSDWEKEFYRNHRDTIDFRAKYTPEELAEQERLKKLLGE